MAQEFGPGRPRDTSPRRRKGLLSALAPGPLVKAAFGGADNAADAAAGVARAGDDVFPTSTGTTGGLQATDNAVPRSGAVDNFEESFSNQGFGSFAPKEGAQITGDAVTDLRSAYQARVDEIGGNTPRALPVNIPGTKITSSDPTSFTPPPAIAAQINDLADEALSRARAAAPGEDLRISSVTISQNWNAGANGFQSRVHADGAGTYMHGLVTLDGQSTIFFKPEVTELVKDVSQAADALFPSIRSVDEQGNMVVDFIRRDREIGESIPVASVRLTPEQYFQPPTGQLSVLTGADRTREVGMSSTLHSSPLPDENNPSRLTLFFGIEKNNK